ncbi:hypothetical protein [Winogradskyella sp.]|uniref:hypothetical protein n=1 Tax=Winogradskyella sp. TaxID=1883156 RepID=UPI00261F4D19|nr:hypothetical protein [uncultured Winogradskyella sp.]
MRTKIGDVFMIKINKGYGCFQLVSSNKFEGELIKVFYKIYDIEPISIEEIVSNDFYFVGFPLKYALKRNLVTQIGNSSLPKDFILPKYMREKHVIGGNHLGWYIVNRDTLQRTFVEKLKIEQRKLSPHGIINDTYLIERFEEDWRLEEWI